ncbi:E3 ubiquitin-protein ligase RNF4-like [Corticium candelabrum]|uniref:E3 ubiquitin-protein ligase RNF4-like n=1 Tax=Corticium candelabrum TaxID=121492 RepID=UPI002E26DC0C|nr:E3 ubiquitin-protein ligase RNF4-like [Corticium candelabrum]
MKPWSSYCINDPAYALGRGGGFKKVCALYAREIVDNFEQPCKERTTDILSEAPHRPVRRAQAIEVVDSDNDEDEGGDVEELLQSDIRWEQHSVISSSSSSNRDVQPSQAVILGITCPVCMDSADQILADKRKLVSTTCGHVFCGKCIRSAIRRQHMCPTCRKRLSLKQFHPIYLT